MWLTSMPFEDSYKDHYACAQCDKKSVCLVTNEKSKMGVESYTDIAPVYILFAFTLSTLYRRLGIITQFCY